MKNNGYKAGAEHGNGIWNLYNWQSLENGPDWGSALSDTWIRGEGIPADIEMHHGMRVIVLGPPSYERSWGCRPSFSGLKASIKVTKTLPAPAVEEWLEKFRS